MFKNAEEDEDLKLIRETLKGYVINFSTRRQVLKSYLLEKEKERDWHGVSDAANDIRVLETKEDSFQAVINLINERLMDNRKGY